MIRKRVDVFSGDPAMGEYIPVAGNNYTPNGGIFNYINLHVYHYSNNNPVNYLDPDGRSEEYAEIYKNRAVKNELEQLEAKVKLSGENIHGLSDSDKLSLYRDRDEQQQLQQRHADLQPLAQTSNELSGIPNMSRYGCYFRASQAVAEFELATTLTADQIVASVTTLQNTTNPTVISNNSTHWMFVHNPDLVINEAFRRLGRTKLRGTVGYGGTGLPNYYIQLGKTNTGGWHYRLLNRRGNLIFDPDPNVQIRNPENRPVYIHRSRR